MAVGRVRIPNILSCNDLRGKFDDPALGAHGFAVARKDNPVIKASLLAPLVIIPIIALTALGVLILKGSPKDAGQFALIYALYGLPIAYGTLLLVGLPAYFLARWLDAVSYPAALLAAAIACVTAGALPDGQSLNVLASLILFAFGAPIAVVFVRIIRRGSLIGIPG